MTKNRKLCAQFVCVTLAAFGLVAYGATIAVADGAGTTFEISANELDDKIGGGLLGQIIGNLNGLPHEMKYIHEPGEVRNYRPHLPNGARTDDDTDLEWVYVTAIENSPDPFLPPNQITRLWRTHVNRGIWCANRYARDLMEFGIEPPLTGRTALNPWAEFNIAGQFVCESFGLMAPAMPQTASRIALHYTEVSVDGEPTQATQFFVTMIAMAFVEPDLDKLLDAGLAAVDPSSEICEVVQQTRRFHKQHPTDWRATRRLIKDRWQQHNGETRDWNGYEINTACTVAVLLYGQGDMLETLRLAFNFGWDCDNNAATAATMLGVIRGRSWIDAQGWEIADRYRNTTRDEMPTDETITCFQRHLAACAHAAILRGGGTETTINGQSTYFIRIERSANVKPMIDAEAQRDRLRKSLAASLEQDLGGPHRARAAYIAICIGEADALRSTMPEQWAEAVAEFKNYPQVLRNLADAPSPSGDALRAEFTREGLLPLPARD